MKTVVLIRLEIESENRANAFDSVDRALDEGQPQNSINEWLNGEVLNATAYSESDALHLSKREVYDTVLAILAEPVTLVEVDALPTGTAYDKQELLVIEDKIRALRDKL